ncbi:MAG: glutathionylspermidine synthase family protein [Gemmatimonadaceae bacterium]
MYPRQESKGARLAGDSERRARRTALAAARPGAPARDDVKRVATPPRADWEEKVASVGLVWHTPDGTPYWDESAYYEILSPEVDVLETATNELHAICLEAVQHVIDRARWRELSIPDSAAALITQSWEEEPPAIYGRFDLAYDGTSPPTLLEYNADTPTALLEAAVVQWHWIQERFPDRDQFNSIHDRLIAGWKDLAPYLGEGPLYFASMDEWEDTITTAYMRDTAQQAGITTAQIGVAAVGWDSVRRRFVDDADRPIATCFKLYPWEWMVREAFAPHLLEAAAATRWIEPAWKMVLSNKGILPILWELHTGHPNLLECYFEPGRGRLSAYAQKPLLSREGANVTLVAPGVHEATAGTYGDEGFVYQALAPGMEHDGRYAVIGSWVIQGESAGIGIRESLSRVTDNRSRFVPHLIG